MTIFFVFWEGVFDMSSKRSILNRVLYLNLTIAVVLTLVFLCTSGLYTRQLTRERYNLASTTLTKVNTDFQLEMNRLDSLLTLCLQDSSLVFSISDRLDTSFFLDNAEDAASRLSLIRQSLPYAKLVYLYTHNSDKVVRDNGSLYKGKDFSRIVLDKTVEDISQLPDGLSFFQDSTALYVKNLYSRTGPFQICQHQQDHRRPVPGLCGPAERRALPHRK